MSRWTQNEMFLHLVEVIKLQQLLIGKLEQELEQLRENEQDVG